MERLPGRVDEPRQRELPRSPLGQIGTLFRLALLAASLSAQACPGAGQRGRTSGVDAGDGKSATTDVNGDRRVVVADAGSVMDAIDAGGDCHEPDDVKGGGVGACFHGDGKGGADAGVEAGNRD